MSNYVPKPNTGTLWPNERKSFQSHPDKRGDVFFDRAFLQDMINKSDGDLVKIQISGWEKVIAGKDCLSLSASAPYVKQEGKTYSGDNKSYGAKPKPEPVREKEYRDESDIPF